MTNDESQEWLKGNYTMTNIIPTDEEMNKRIHEILGMCWHYYTYMGAKQDTYLCIHCGDMISTPASKIDFTTSWEGYGILIKWIQSRQGYNSFLYKYGYERKGKFYLEERYISPRGLAEATVEFFKGDK